MPLVMADVREIVGDLRRLGIVPGDTAMVHASMRAIGPIDGGAAGLITALDSAVGGEGSLLMVLGAHDEYAWVNERPEADRAGLLQGTAAFDPLTTPAESDLGVLAEVFRKSPGTLV